MILFALKSDEGYLKIDQNGTFTLVSMNKASVYPKDKLEQLKEYAILFENKVIGLRIVQMVIAETDPYLD